MKDEFSRLHPAVGFAYFALVLTFAMWFTNPLFQAISLAAAFAYSIYLRGGRAVRTDFLTLVPLMLVTALLNPCFSHQGVTTLAYLPSGNPLTEESIFYGLSAGAMLAGTICWFSCLNEVLTSDKFVYLFGRTAPALSVLLSMTLRFVQRFNRQLRRVSSARRASGGRQTVGEALSVFSGVTGWAMENAVETADSMKCRGWGLGGRTAYSCFRFDGRALGWLGFIIADGAFIIFCKLTGALYWRYYPSVKGSFTALTFCAAAAYAALCLAPLAADLLEDGKWNVLRSEL